VGDEMGKVRIQDLSAILRLDKLAEKIRPVGKPKHKRNPYRLIDIEHQKSKKTERTGCWDTLAEDDTEQVRTRTPLLNEAEIIQTAQFDAHKDVIRSIQYVDVTDEPLIFTASADRYVKIFNLRGEEQGCLKQGYLIKTDY
jgi:hypothetical protein